jgi:hypothetical protein
MQNIKYVYVIEEWISSVNVIVQSLVLDVLESIH